MHESEADSLSTCVDCGAEIGAGPDEAFTFGSTGVLCNACALRRGGRYDAARDHWVGEPDLSDLGREFE